MRAHTTTASRRTLMKWGAGLSLAAALPVGRTNLALAQDDAVWEVAPDAGQAAEQVKEIISYGMPDDWANYGEVFKGFQASLGITDGTHVDTDMSSLEEITKFDAEKSNPVAMFADIGMLWGPVASERGVTPNYLPPAAESLPEGYKGANGGWVASFAGVPAFVVNVDALNGGDIPMTWDDLLREDLKGKVGSSGDPRSSGTSQTTFLAWVYAHGGDATNLAPGVEYSKQIIQQYNAADASLDLLEKGEIALWMRYDFNCEAAVAQLKEKGINAQTVIPGVSIYAPSAMMVNRFNTARKDAGQLFMEYVLSDEAANAFARFGARPIRYVLGQQELSEDATAKWLPEEQYKDVVVVENFTDIDANGIAAAWEDEVLVVSEGITLTAEHAAAHPARARAAVSVRAGLAAWLPALPLLLLALFLLVLPTITLILGSFGLPGRLTLEYWVDTFQSNGGRQAILTSIRLGLVCGLLSMVIGGPLAWFISRMVTGSRSLWLALLNVAANFGGIGLAFGYMAALGTYGMVTLGLQELHILWAPPEIGSFASLVMAYLYTNIPLFVLLTLPAMAIVRQDWFEAAEVCKASRWQFWRYIGLPVLSPFFLAGFLLIFTWSIGIYGLAFALGNSAATTGKLRLITLQIGISLNSGVGTEERSFVLATVLLILAAVALLTYRRVMKRALRWFS